MSLVVDGINVSYGNAQVLYGFSFSAEAGAITCLLGRNGAGKTTTLRAIMGLLPLKGGNILLDGNDISARPASDTASQGVALVPQGRRLFGELSVSENLEVGLMARGKPTSANRKRIRERVLELFPRLSERMGQTASTLSGGEQQMLATARALCIEPQVLLLDEPTEGLQPSIAALLRDVSRQLANEGVAVILVEQQIDSVMTLADHAVLIENGRGIGSLDKSTLNRERLTQHLGV